MITDGAADKVYPHDVAVLSQAIRMLDRNAGLRDEFIDKGPQRADRFSSQTYQQCLGQLCGKVVIR